MGKDARGAQRAEKLWLEREASRRLKKAKAAASPAQGPPVTQGGPGIGVIGKKGVLGVR